MTGYTRAERLLMRYMAPAETTPPDSLAVDVIAFTFALLILIGAWLVAGGGA